MISPFSSQNIALLDIADNQEVLQQLRTEFASAKVILLLTDIAKQEVVEKTFKKIIENFQHVDVVVNCAGVVCEQSLERTMNVNLVITAFSSSLDVVYLVLTLRLFNAQIGLINVSMVALDVMSKMKGGNGGIIVNVSSIAGLVALPGAPFYNASKHGVIGFTRTMAVSAHLQHAIELFDSLTNHSLLSFRMTFTSKNMAFNSPQFVRVSLKRRSCRKA